MNRDTCERASCQRPQKAKGLCVLHYGREHDQGRKRKRTPAKILRSRARVRAVGWLIDAHRDEFTQLLGKAQVEVETEAAVLAAICDDQGVEPTHDRKVFQLRPGPASVDDEGVEDRLRLIQPEQCAACQTFHEKGHACDVCTAPAVERAQLARKSPEQRIRYFLEAGKTARWIVDNGESRDLVLAVMATMRAERESATA